MKNLIILMLGICLFAGCKDSTPPRYASSSPEIDVVKSLVSDYEEGDWEAWKSHYADTAKLHHNSKEPSSLSEIQEGLSEILADVNSYSFEDDDIFYEMVIDDQGEKWVNFWGNWEGTLAGNGQELNIPVHLTLQFVDGKIVEEHAYYDMSEYITAKQAMSAAERSEEDVMAED